MTVQAARGDRAAAARRPAAGGRKPQADDRSAAAALGSAEIAAALALAAAASSEAAANQGASGQVRDLLDPEVGPASQVAGIDVTALGLDELGEIDAVGAAAPAGVDVTGLALEDLLSFEMAADAASDAPSGAGPEVDLTGLDLAALMSLQVAGDAPEEDPAEVDVASLEIEDLLGFDVAAGDGGEAEGGEGGEGGDGGEGGEAGAATGGGLVVEDDGAETPVADGGGSAEPIDGTSMTPTSPAETEETATEPVSEPAPNGAPAAADDGFAGKEDTQITGNVLANDTDPEGDALGVTSTGSFGTAQGGTVEIAADGSFVYTPAPDFNGADSFDYTVSDGNGGTATGSVTLQVKPVNDAPGAQDDAVTTEEGATVDIDVLGNDDDSDGDGLSVASATQGANGSVVVAPDGMVSYTPDAGFSGDDSFTYTVSDGNGGTSTATVTVTVDPVNDAPDAQDDATTTPVDAAVTLDVLANDSDPDGDPLTVASVTQGANGSVEINPDGTLTYTPDAGYSGGDSFTYTVDDGNGGSATATVTIAVGTGVALDGTDGPDILIGTAGDDVLDGLGGNDTLNGLGGNDILIGGAGADELDGGNDVDTAGYGGSSAGVTVDLATGVGSGGDAEGDTLISIENLQGSKFDDVLTGDANDNRIHGGLGNDSLDGAAGADWLHGGAGNDIVIGGSGADWLHGGSGNDILDGGAGADSLNGGAGIDILNGGLDADILDGGSGSDVVLGGAGNDTLNGGSGSDVLQGGAGADSFVFAPGTGSDIDVIADFSGGEDVIDLTAYGLADTTDLTITNDGSGNAVVTLPGGDSITLAAIDETTLTDADFVF